MAPRERGGVCASDAACFTSPRLRGEVGDGTQRSLRVRGTIGDPSLPLTRSQDARDLSPHAGRGEERRRRESTSSHPPTPASASLRPTLPTKGGGIRKSEPPPHPLARCSRPLPARGAR